MEFIRDCKDLIITGPIGTGKSYLRWRSTMVTSQIPVKDWYDVIGEKTIADAVLDRIVHHSLRVELFGESIRERKAKSENDYV